MSDPKTFLIDMKYHPKTMDELILPKRIKGILEGVVNSENIPGFVFSGPPGCGKTTAAKVVCDAIDVESRTIQSSVYNGVDFVRGPLVDMAETSTLNGKYKCLILDESDYMSKEAQSALRNVINTTQSFCRYILTANYPQKIIPAIRGSRLDEISFAFTRDEIIHEVAGDLWKRLMYIIKSEGYTIENYESFQKWMVKNLPNIRYILRTIQIHGQNSGIIPATINDTNTDLDKETFSKLMKASHVDLVKFVYATPQETIMQYVLDNLESLTSDESKQMQILNWASAFQGQSKGIEELYTITFLKNLRSVL